VAKIKESLAKTLQERLGTGEKSLKHDQYPSIQGTTSHGNVKPSSFS
jgi:hypothetical protein